MINTMSYTYSEMLCMLTGMYRGTAGWHELTSDPVFNAIDLGLIFKTNTGQFEFAPTGY